MNVKLNFSMLSLSVVALCALTACKDDDLRPVVPTPEGGAAGGAAMGASGVGATSSSYDEDDWANTLPGSRTASIAIDGAEVERIFETKFGSGCTLHEHTGNVPSYIVVKRTLDLSVENKESGVSYAVSVPAEALNLFYLTKDSAETTLVLGDLAMLTIKTKDSKFVYDPKAQNEMDCRIMFSVVDDLTLKSTLTCEKLYKSVGGVNTLVGPITVKQSCTRLSYTTQEW